MPTVHKIHQKLKAWGVGAGGVVLGRCRWSPGDPAPAQGQGSPGGGGFTSPS